MNRIKSVLRWLLAALCALLPGCVTNPSTGEHEFSPRSAVKALRAGKVVAEEMAHELSISFPETSEGLLRIADSLDDAAAVASLLGTGEILDGDIYAQLQTILVGVSTVAQSIDDEEHRERVEAVLSSLRVAVRVAQIYSGEGDQ